MSDIETRYLAGHCVRAADAEDNGALSFVAATEGVKGDGLSLRMAGVNLDRFLKSPVVFWGHDWSSVPIGKAAVRVEGDKLMADITFDQNDEFARKIDRKYRDGFLSSVSVGFDFNKVERDGSVNDWQLLEISAVPIPTDPDAMLVKQRAALRDLGTRLLVACEENEPAVTEADTHTRELTAFVADLIRETVAAEVAKFTVLAPDVVEEATTDTIVESVPAEDKAEDVDLSALSEVLAALDLGE